MPIRIVQVSDTHVSAKRAYFIDNWRVFQATMAAAPPDLIVHTGDCSFDGAGDADDLAFARAEMGRISAPWLAIPGNHDIGEAHIAVRLDQPVTDARISHWTGHFGPQWWCRDVGAWRLVGIDTSLLGSTIAAADAQIEFLEACVSGRGTRPILLFQHMPPYLDAPEDEKPTHLAVPAGPRRWLLELCRLGGVKVVACGHCHVYRRLAYQGIEIVWAPATSFFNFVERQRQGWGVPRAGFIEWTLEGTSISHRLIEPPLMITHDVGAWNKAHGSTTHMPPRPLGEV